MSDHQEADNSDFVHLADLALAPLAEALQIEALAFDDNNECVLTVDGKFVVLMVLDLGNTNSIILNIPLGYLPQNGQREGLLFRLLAGNYCWGLTEGGTLGIDEASDQVSLCYLVPLPLAEPQQMPAIVGKLVSVAAYWMARIAEASGGGDAAGGAPAGEMMLRV